MGTFEYKDNELCLDRLNIGGIRLTNILCLNPKDMVGNLIIQSKRKAASFLALNENDILSFLIMTDIHADDRNFRRVIEFSDEYNNYIDDYIQLGDVVRDNYGDDFSFFSENEFSRKVMNVIGNHDTRATISERSTSQNQWTEHAGIDAYNRYIAPFKSHWVRNVVQPENAESEGLCYYYKDYVNSKVRLIVVDCMKRTAEQLSWFVDTLSNAAELGYSVAVAQHTNFGTIRSIGAFGSNDLSYSDKENAFGGSVDDYMNAVDTFMNNGGDFICWLTGHMHIDMSGWIAEHPNQFALIFENTLLSNTYSESDRVLNEKSQDSFNIVSFDTNRSLLKIVRVGNDCNRYLQSKKYLVINYKTKQIISQG